MSKMPENYEEVIGKVKEKTKASEELTKMKPIADILVKKWDNLSETEQKFVSKLIPNWEDLIERLRKI